MKHHWAIIILAVLSGLAKIKADTGVEDHTSLQEITRVLAKGSGISFPVKTKTLRIVGYGNSENRWNSYLHVAFQGDPIAATEIDVTASGSEEGNPPENTLDGDLNTRWSSLGPGEWIAFEFGEEKTVTGVEIHLPVRHDGKQIHTGDLNPIEAENVFYGLFHHNPSSDRYIFLVDTTSLATEKLQEVIHSDSLIRHGMDLRDPMTTPDFVAVRNGLALRFLQFNKDWQFDRNDDYGTPLPDVFNCPETLAQHRAIEMVNRTGADYALIAPASRWRLSATMVDAEYFTLGDWNVRQHEAPLLLGTLTGQQLLNLHETLISEGRLLTSPELTPHDLDEEFNYSVVGYTDLIWDLLPTGISIAAIQAGPDME